MLYYFSCALFLSPSKLESADSLARKTSRFETLCVDRVYSLCLAYCFGALETIILDEDNDNEIAIAHDGIGKEKNTSSEYVTVKDETMVKKGKGKEGEGENGTAGKGEGVDGASSAIVKMNGAVTEEVTVADVAGDSEKCMPGERQEENNTEDNESDADGPAQAIVEEGRLVEEAKRISISITTVAPMIMQCKVGEGHGQNIAKDEKDMASDASCADSLAVTIVEEDRVMNDTERFKIGATTGAPVVRGLEWGEKQDNSGNASTAVVVEDTVVDKVERVAIPGSTNAKRAEIRMENDTEGQEGRVDVAFTVLGPVIAVMEEDRDMDDIERIDIAGSAGTPVDIEEEWGEDNEEEKAKGGRDIVHDASATNDPADVALEKQRVMDEAGEVAAFITSGPLVERNRAGGDEGEKNKAVCEEDRVDSFSAAKGATVIMVEENRGIDLADVVTGGGATFTPMAREDRIADGQEKNNVEGGNDQVENEAEEVSIIDASGASEVMEGDVGEGQEQNNKEAENDSEDDISAIDNPLAAVVEDDRVVDESIRISIAVSADTSVVREDRKRERQDDINAEGNEEGVDDPHATDVPPVTVMEGENVVDEVEQDSVNALATINEGGRVVDLAEEVVNTVRDNGKGDGQEICNVEGGEGRVDDTFAAIVEGHQVENEAEKVAIVDVGGISEVMEDDVGEGQEHNNNDAENDRADNASANDVPASVLLEENRVINEAEGIAVAPIADTSVVREDRREEGQDDINGEGDEDVVDEVPERGKVVDEVEQVTGVISPVASLIQEGEEKEELEADNEVDEQDSVNALATTSEVDRVVCDPEVVATPGSTDIPVFEESEEG